MGQQGGIIMQMQKQDGVGHRAVVQYAAGGAEGHRQGTGVRVEGGEGVLWTCGHVGADRVTARECVEC